jgi:hypothetical protein
LAHDLGANVGHLAVPAQESPSKTFSMAESKKTMTIVAAALARMGSRL